MITILLTTFIAALLTVIFNKHIKTYAIALYILAGVVAALVDSHTSNIISRGYVSFGIYLLVMFMGVLDKGKLRNKLLSVRGELAIIATILLIPHAWGYFEYYGLELGFWATTVSFYVGIAAFVLVLPLTLTSFRWVRKKLGYVRWKKLHNWSYLFYGVVGLHLILIDNTNMWSYIALFGVYGFMKVMVLIKDQKEKEMKRKQMALRKAQN